MRKLLPLSLGVLVCLSYTTIARCQEPDQGTHDLTGPVRVVWEARCSDPGFVSSAAGQIAVSPDGGTVFVAGSSSNPGAPNGDYATVAYDAGTGEQLWVSAYDGPASAKDGISSIVVSPDGSKLFVTGESGISVIWPDRFHDDYATVAYDANTGDEIWVARYDGPASAKDSPRQIAVSPDGSKVFVTGNSDTLEHRPNRYHDDYATVAYDANTGDEIWVSLYDGPDSTVDWATSISVSPDGGMIFVTGVSTGVSSLTDFATVAYDANTGDEIWVSRYDGPDSRRDGGLSINVSPDGGIVFVTGNSGRDAFDPLGHTRDTGGVTVAYDAATGDEIWVARYDGPASAADESLQIAVSPDGSRIFVTGRCDSLLDPHGDYYHDYATVAYDALTGDEIWVSLYDGPDSTSDTAVSISVSPDGGMVFVTGTSDYFPYAPWPGDLNRDWATVAYDAATGEEIWVARYDGPASAGDAALSIIASPDGGRVFVTGSSRTGSGKDSSFATVAYALVVPIEIDVKPRNETNPINPRAHGVTPVALLGSEEFDVTEVEPTTLRFGPGEAAPVHDLTNGWPYSDPLRDVNRDGYTDLLVHFSTQESSIQCSDTEVTLTGQLIDGFFIEGTDTIRTVGCSHKVLSHSGQE
jgi:outer membrane protein assembly factor BamB